MIHAIVFKAENLTQMEIPATYAKSIIVLYAVMIINVIAVKII
jgi:hypothetical protein